MRKLGALALAGVLFGCGRSFSPLGTNKIATLEDSVSYVLGYQLGSQAKQEAVKLSPAVLLRGLNDAFGGTPGALTQEQMQSAMASFQAKMVAARQSRDSASGLVNQKAGDDFLTRNRTAPGVVTTPSGLQYKILKPGSGPRPKPTSVVTVHYRGTLLDGTEFDKSGKDPVSFPLNRVISGWTEGLQLMNAGARYQFWIPANLAYGPAGSPPRIGPNQTLVFEVELVSFK
jgi:FKBP-type peptidyl-prolyl cis-trans isomerase